MFNQAKKNAHVACINMGAKAVLPPPSSIST